MRAIELRKILIIVFTGLNFVARAAEDVPPVPPGALTPGKLTPIPRPAGLPAPPIVATPLPSAPMPPAITNEVLAFDSLLKQGNGKPGDTNVNFTFSLTNIYTTDVLINNVRTSCGCTVASLPSKPWRLPPGSNGLVGVSVDVRGKFGTLTKSVYIDATAGTNNAMVVLPTLNVSVVLPNQPQFANMGDRAKNMQMAMADRQAVFRNDCAKCHAEAGAGKLGLALYEADCANCHNSQHRASMVPDLRNLNHPTSAEHWKTWITSGKPNTLMPAFAKAQGGPLTDEQIDSLVDYLVKNFPSKSTAAAPASSQTAAGSTPAGPTPQ